MNNERLKSLATELVHPDRHFEVPRVREVAAFHISRLASVARLQSLPDNVYLHKPEIDSEPPEPPQSDAIAA